MKKNHQSNSQEACLHSEASTEQFKQLVSENEKTKKNVPEMFEEVVSLQKTSSESFKLFEQTLKNTTSVQSNMLKEGFNDSTTVLKRILKRSYQKLLMTLTIWSVISICVLLVFLISPKNPKGSAGSVTAPPSQPVRIEDMREDLMLMETNQAQKQQINMLKEKLRILQESDRLDAFAKRYMRQGRKHWEVSTVDGWKQLKDPKEGK